MSFITEHLGSCSGLLPRAPSSLFPPTRLLSLPRPLLSALASSVLNCSCPQGLSRRGQADRSHTVASGAGIAILTRTFQARTPPLRWGGEETHSRAHNWLVAELGLDPTQVHGMFCWVLLQLCLLSVALGCQQEVHGSCNLSDRVGDSVLEASLPGG